MLTIDTVKKALPPQLNTTVSQNMVDQLNNLSNDPEAARVMRDNFISYTNVMKDGKFKLDDYVHAVAYVSYKMMGYNNRESYSRTFPGRYQNLVAAGKNDKDISSYVAAYNKNKLVNLVLEQTLIPVHVLNQDIFQKAINAQADLMINAKSEKVRADAANSLLTHLKKPESKAVELDINVKESEGLRDLKDTLQEMAKQQQDMIEGGQSTKTIAHQNLIRSDDVEDAEIIEEKTDE